MDVKIIQQIKNDVIFLENLSEKHVGEIAELAWEFISQGSPNRNLYKNLAQTLSLGPSAIESIISGVAFLLLETAKHKVTQEQFLEQAPTLELPPPALQAIYETYRTHQRQLTEALRGSEIDSAQFRDLQWRLQSQIASRCLRVSSEPLVVIKLDLERQGNSESIALVSDIPNIIHWNQMVEQALAEARTHNARKIQRAVS